MAEVYDITPHVEITGTAEAEAALNHFADIGAEAFAKIIRAAAQGDLTGLATMVGGKLAGSFTEAAHAVYEFVDAQAGAAEVLSALAESTGMNIAQIEGVKDAFASVGISTSGFQRAMSRLAITLARDWSSIQQSIRTSADSQQSALLGVESSVLAVQRAYMELNNAGQDAMAEAKHNAEAIVSAQLGVQKATLNQMKDLGVNVAPLEKILKAQEDINAIAKAREALEDANRKAVEAEEKATLDLQEKALAVQKAEQAHAAALEKSYEVSLKNIPAIAADIDKVVKGYQTWDDVANKADITTQNLGHALELAASGDMSGQKGPAKALDVLREMAALFPKMGDDALAVNQKMGIIQRTMASMGGGGGGGTMGTPAQFLAVLDRGLPEFDKFQQLTDKFSKTNIGLNMTNGLSPVVDTLKTFNAAWSELDALLDQVRAHFAAIFASGLTELFNTIQESITNTNGTLYKLIDSAEALATDFTSALEAILPIFTAIVEGIGEIIAKVQALTGLNLHTVFLGLELAAGSAAVALGAVGKGLALILEGLGALTKNKTLKELGDTASKVADNIAAAGHSAVTSAVVGAINGREQLHTGVPGEVPKEPANGTGLETAAAVQHEAGNTLLDAGRNLGDAAEKLRDALAPQGRPAPQTVEGRAAGGLIRGPGGPKSDTAGIFALSDHEYVVQSAAVRHYGVELFEALNSLAVGGFATGGLVSRVAGVSVPLAGHQASSILNLTIDGQKFTGLRAPADTAAKLKMYAVSRQSSAAGRNPSWLR